MTRRWIVRVGHRHEIEREVLRRFPFAGAGVQNVAFGIPQDRSLRHGGVFERRGIRVDQVLVPHDQHSFRQAGEQRIGALDALHDQRSRSPAKHLRIAESMNMRVIPIQARRRVRRNLEAILEGRVARRDHRFEHVILVANRAARTGRENAGSWMSAVISPIRARIGHRHGHLHGHRHRHRLALSCSRAREKALEIVLQTQNQPIAGMHAKVGRDAAVPGLIAIAHLAAARRERCDISAQLSACRSGCADLAVRESRCRLRDAGRFRPKRSSRAQQPGPERAWHRGNEAEIATEKDFR